MSPCAVAACCQQYVQALGSHCCHCLLVPCKLNNTMKATHCMAMVVQHMQSCSMHTCCLPLCLPVKHSLDMCTPLPLAHTHHATDCLGQHDTAVLLFICTRVHHPAGLESSTECSAARALLCMKHPPFAGECCHKRWCAAHHPWCTGIRFICCTGV